MTEKFDLKAFFLNKTEIERAEFATRAGTTVNYLQNHLIRRNKMPRKKMMHSMVNASNGAFTMPDLIKFFYDEL